MSVTAKAIVVLGVALFVMLIVRSPATAADLVLGVWHGFEKIGDFFVYLISKG